MDSTALVKCPDCGKTLKVKQETLDGRKGRCPGCRHAFVLRSAVISSGAAPSSRQSESPGTKRAGASSGAKARPGSPGKSASRRTVKKDDYDDYGFNDDQPDYQPAMPRGKRTAKASRAGARRKAAKSGGGGNLLLVVMLLVAFLGLGAAGGGLYWWLQSPSETVGAVDSTDVAGGANVDMVADTSSPAPEQQQAQQQQAQQQQAQQQQAQQQQAQQQQHQAQQSSAPVQSQGQHDAEMPADGSLAANMPEPNVPVASDLFGISPRPTFSGGESMAEDAVSNAAREIQNKIEASMRNNMAGFNSLQDAGKPGQPSQRRTGDDVFAYNVPQGRSNRTTLSTSGAYGKMDVEVVEVSANQGVIFRVTQLKYPTSAKRKLKNAEKVLHEAAESILSQRQNSSVKSSGLITDFACPGVEYEFQADSITGFSTRPNRITMRVYLLDVSMYLFQVEVPGDLDYSQVDGVVNDFLNSIALSSGDLPPSTARALAGREPDAEEVQAIAHMEKIYDGLIKARSQKEAQLLQDFKDMLEKKESKSARAQVVPDTKLLSWRVHILPLIGEEALYRRFQLDEPWDSSHNRKLLDSMPQVYECPGVATQVGMTVYQKPDGPGTVWGREKAGTFSTETGTDRIFLLEVDPDQAIEWTRPDDFSIEAITVGSPLVGIGHVRSGGFLVNDGYFLSSEVDLKLFRDLCLHGTRVRLP